MSRPVWEWLVESGMNAFQATQKFGGPSPVDAGPGWCFDRFGCSKTMLPDGRVIRIAGEHEDHYDPDFYIYNDVIVLHPDRRVEIFGYPEAVFAPTDFHSATRVGDFIWIIGSLGYEAKRVHNTTPVYQLDLRNFEIQRVETSGECPGWIHRHTAVLAGDGASITVSRGMVEDAGNDAPHRDNLDDWSLNLSTRTWTRLSHRPGQRWFVHRADGQGLMLFEMMMSVMHEKYPQLADGEDLFPEVTRALVDCGVEPDPVKALEDAGRSLDSQVYDQLYMPPVEHRVMEPACSDDEDEDGGESSDYVTKQLYIGETLVRYVEEFNHIGVVIEGTLDEAVTDTVTADLCAKLSKLQNAACVVSEAPPEDAWEASEEEEEDTGSTPQTVDE